MDAIFLQPAEADARLMLGKLTIVISLIIRVS